MKILIFFLLLSSFLVTTKAQGCYDPLIQGISNPFHNFIGQSRDEISGMFSSCESESSNNTSLVIKDAGFVYRFLFNNASICISGSIFFSDNNTIAKMTKYWSFEIGNLETNEWSISKVRVFDKGKIEFLASHPEKGEFQIIYSPRAVLHFIRQ